MVVPHAPFVSTPLTEQILAEAAALPLPDAALALWAQRSTFIRAAEAANPQDLSDPLSAAFHGQLFAADLARDRLAAPESGTYLRLKYVHPKASDAELRDAIIAAVKFDDDCTRFFANDGTDFWQQVTRAVERAGKSSPAYLETTLRDARNRLATSMR